MHARRDPSRTRRTYIRTYIEAQGGELGLVALAALGGVVGHEEHALAGLAELLQDGRHLLDQRVPAPDDAVAVEDEHVHLMFRLNWDE